MPTSLPKLNPRLVIVLYALTDALITVLAYRATLSVRLVTTPFTLMHVENLILYAAIMVGMLILFGVYRRIWAQTSGHGITVIFNAVAAATVAQVAVSLMVQPRPMPLGVIVLANPLAFGGFVLLRYRSRLISGISWRWQAVWHRQFPRTRTRVLIIGAGESGQDLAWRLKHRFPSSDYLVAGFIDDDRDKQGMLVEGCPVLGTRRDLLRITEEYRIDLLVVALHNISGAAFREILALCEHTSARIKVVPDLFQLVNAPDTRSLLRDVQPEDLIGRTSITRYKGVDLTPVTGKRILITGAAGSIGSELSRQILDYEPACVVLLDNNESGLHDLMVELSMRDPDAKLIPALVDVSMRDMLETVFEQHTPHIVFHAAAYKHVHLMEYYPREALRVNVGGTLNLAELALAHDVERFVLISTDKAVNPQGMMGASKRACELLLHALCSHAECTTVFTSVRFGNVLGSRGSIVPTFNRQIDSGGPVTVTHPEMTRYFMSIPEAVNLIIHAACLTQGDDIFILKMGEVVKIVELAERMIRMRGLRPNKDVQITFTGIRPGEKMHEELYTEAENPVETIHPNIIQLHTWHAFDGDNYVRDLQAILDDRTTPPGDLLPRLVTLMQPEVAQQNGYQNGRA